MEQGAQVDLRQTLDYIEDSVAGLSNGASGIRLVLTDGTSRKEWIQNHLRRLFRLFEARAADVSVTWLRPIVSPGKLEVAASENLQEQMRHYKYRLGEGLAGRVWERGEPATHHAGSPHPWWKERVGCENATYICAPVGEARGQGGVLGVGSDIGFACAEDDREVVRVFAGLLDSVARAQQVGAEARRALRQEISALGASTRQMRTRAVASPQHAEDFNRLLQEARGIKGVGPGIASLQTLSLDARHTYGELEMRITALLQALTPR
jgi:hypothetical protein